MIRVFDAGPAMAPVLARLHASVFPRPWDSQAIGELLAMPGALALLASVESAPGVDRGAGAPQPAGFVIARLAADEGEIITIAAHPDHRRHGIGRRLLAAVIDKLRAQGAAALFLEVAAGNHPARAFYEQAGFRQTGRRAGYYRAADGTAADALVYRLRTTSR